MSAGTIAATPSRAVSAKHVGIAGVALAAIAWFITLPPFLVRTPVPSIIIAGPLFARFAARLSETRLKFKRLTTAELDGYLAGGEWSGKAGGYGIQGAAGAFVTDLNGSYSGVVGLPLYETRALLRWAGYPLA